MKKKFTFLIAALFALMLITLPGVVKGQSDYSAVYTSQDGLLSTTGGSNLTASKISIGGTNYDCIKGGTSSKAGVWKITVPSGTKYLHLHAAAYTGTSVTLTSSPTGYNVSLSDAASITGNPPFTFNQDASSANYYKVITFTTALANNLTITFTAKGGNRFAVWGVNAEEESTATLASISLSGTYPTSFYQGDAFSHEGMIVTAIYDDESSANVTSSAVFSGYNMSTLGNQTVTVSYTENNVTKTQTYSITVNALPTYTVTLGDDNSTLTEASAGAGVELPSRGAIGDYSFFKWSETNVSTETTTAPATLIPAGTYHPTSDITLYPVYTRTESSGSGTTDVPVSTTIAAYASANSWTSGERYTSISLDGNVTISGKNNGNNSKYYSTSPGTWRHYGNDSGEITVTTTSGTIKDVTITYTGNTLTYGESNVTSGTAINVSGTSAVFAVSGSSGNTQVSAIGVTYTVSGSSTTYYWSSPTLPAVATPVITPENNPFLFSTTATITCETDGAEIKYSYDGETWYNYSVAITITETKTIHAKAILDQDESSVTTLTITKNLADPTVTVSGDLIVDLDGETNVNAGTLSATVTYNNEAVTGATVTWGSNHTEIATIDESTGAVTLLTTGEVTFTATYAGNSDYSEASGTKTVTVVNSKAPGTEGNPYTVAQAKANTPSSGTSANVYIHGIVSKFEKANIISDGSNYRYYISDDGTTTNQLLVYKGKGLNNVTFSNADDLLVGDIVTIYGGLTTYNSTKEIASGNYLISVVRPGTGSNPATIAGTVVDFTIANDENYIVASNTTLTVTGTLTNNGTAANLVIEDGGQLITNNAVAATVKKNVTGYNSGAKDGTSGWYFIASPINSSTLKPSEVGNMLTDQVSAPYSYDLYRFNDQADNGLSWENYHAHNNIADPFYLVNGMGYLYANENGVNLEFSGTIRPSDDPVTVSDLKEKYNLVGNPFTCNAYINTDYYELVGGNTIKASTTDKSNPITPNTGIIVESTDGGSVKFSKDYPVTSANNGNLELTLTQAVANSNTRGESVQTLDNAIVSFNEGSKLGKFYFGQQNANIYIPMDNEEYAIVSTEARGEMPVNFKAAQDGQYTITVNAEEVEMGYLHLIDNIAGTDIDLLATPSYTFNAKGDDYESRFRLIFSANNENQNENEKDFAFFSNGQLIVTGEGTLQVVDMMGRVISTEVINGTSSKTIDAKAGVYVLRLINGENVKTQKIVVK